MSNEEKVENEEAKTVNPADAYANLSFNNDLVNGLIDKTNQDAEEREAGKGQRGDFSNICYVSNGTLKGKLLIDPEGVLYRQGKYVRIDKKYVSDQLPPEKLENLKSLIDQVYGDDFKFNFGYMTLFYMFITDFEGDYDAKYVKKNELSLVVAKGAKTLPALQTFMNDSAKSSPEEFSNLINPMKQSYQVSMNKTAGTQGSVGFSMNLVKTEFPEGELVKLKPLNRGGFLPEIGSDKEMENYEHIVKFLQGKLGQQYVDPSASNESKEDDKKEEKKEDENPICFGNASKDKADCINCPKLIECAKATSSK